MAVFLENVCTFGRCDKIFHTLPGLIVHIEDNHIDYNKKPDTVPDCLPLSYILRYQSVFGSDEQCSSKTEICIKREKDLHIPVPTKTSRKPGIISNLGDRRNYGQNRHKSDNNVVGSSQKASQSKATLPFQLKENDKPYECTLNGCQRKYKNMSGLKYHLKNGHKTLVQVIKDYYCPICNKHYKTVRGLNNHIPTHTKPKTANCSRAVKHEPLMYHNFGLPYDITARRQVFSNLLSHKNVYVNTPLIKPNYYLNSCCAASNSNKFSYNVFSASKYYY